MKNICKGNKGYNNDSFPHTQFIQDLASSGLDPQIYLLYVYRVAVDHYTLNPTKVTLTSHPYKGRTQNVKIDDNILRKILESAKDVLSFLDNY